MATTHMRMLYTQNKLLLDTLINFYKNKEYLNKMVSIINGASKLSLRIIDWFVTNYSKKYFVVYYLPNPQLSSPTSSSSLTSYSFIQIQNPTTETVKDNSSEENDPFSVAGERKYIKEEEPQDKLETETPCEMIDSSLSHLSATEKPYEGGIRFKVYNEYKLKLKAYGKINFDPFCRWTRITIPFNDEFYIETTIGQLNFFKWAIENEILKYIEEHYEEIEKDMTVRNNTSKNKKHLESSGESNNGGGGGGKTRKKREELSVSACKCIKTENISVVIHF